MKKINVFMMLAFVLLAVTSFTVVTAKKPKLAGTSWKMESSTQMLDGPRVKWICVLHFKDKKTVEITKTNSSSSYNSMRMNPDGTVDRHPGSKTSNTSVGTYKVKGNKVIVTVEEKTTTYLYDGNCLYDLHSLDLIGIMPDYELEQRKYVKMKNEEISD